MLALLLCLLTPAALAQDEEAPEFLLGDVGVRIDLPSGWNAEEWSDWHFKAKTADGGVLLSAWTTPMQTAPAVDNLDAFASTHLGQSKLFGAEEAVMDKTELGARPDMPVGRFEYHFDTDKGGRVQLYGATIAVEGQNLHLLTMAAGRNVRTAQRELDRIVEGLEIHSEPVTLQWGAQVEASGVTATLPEDFRPPLAKVELDHVKTLADPLGVKAEDCAIGVRPHSPAKPDLLVMCQGGMWLGVVDAYTFEDVDVALRPKLFGEAPVDSARRVDLADRSAFVYAPTTGLVMGVVPYDQGLSRTWLLAGDSAAADAVELNAKVDAMLESASFSGAHPASGPDLISYYVLYRPLHPFVLCPALALLMLVGVGGIAVMGAGAVGMRRENPYEDFDEEGA